MVYGYILLEFNFLIVLVLCNLENNKWNFLHNNTKEKKNNVKNREFLYLPAQCNLETQKDIIYFLRSQPSTRIQKEFPLYFTLVPAFCWLSSLTYAYLRCSLWIAQSEYKSNVELMTDQVYPKSDFSGTWNQLKNEFKAS